MYKVLKDIGDWVKYKESLNNEGWTDVKPYSFAHYNKPEKFPCLVKSTFWDDPNGAYSYDHEFLYLEDIKNFCELLGYTP